MGSNVSLRRFPHFANLPGKTYRPIRLLLVKCGVLSLSLFLIMLAMPYLKYVSGARSTSTSKGSLSNPTSSFFLIGTPAAPPFGVSGWRGERAGGLSQPADS